MTKSLTSEVYESFRRVHGWSISLVSVAALVLSLFFGKETEVPLPWVILGALVAFLAIVVLLDLGIRTVARLDTRLPAVRHGGEAPALYRAGLALLLLDPSDLYGQDSVVSIYRRSGSFEELVGLGHVATVQQNGMIQVIVVRDFSVDASLWQSVRGNNGSVLSALMVKPSLPRDAFLPVERYVPSPLGFGGPAHPSWVERMARSWRGVTTETAVVGKSDGFRVTK
jgi:hypothetical protein